MVEDQDNAMENFTVFPAGTQIFQPDEGILAIQFPSQDDAIVFYQFLASFVAGEISLMAVSK